MDNSKTGKKKTRSRKKKASESFMSRNAMVIFIAALAVIIFGGAAAMFLFEGYGGDDRPRITIGRDADNAEVKNRLTSQFGAAFGTKVYELWRLQGGDAAKAHGSYCVEPGESAVKLARRMAKGRQTPVSLTFNNIRTIDQLAERLSRQLELGPDEVKAAMETLLPAKGFDKAAFPAAFLPDTYEVYWTVSGTELVEKLSSERSRFWNDERRAKARRLGLTPVEVATIASIVEEETSRRDEMGKVARLYLNRVGRKMKLQADPTVKFAIGDFSIRRITAPMLRTSSPYNTYMAPGLPPGPIRVAAASTIDAVLDAPAHNYLYMCAKEDFSGYHNFAADYATHQANARRYQAELDRRNIH